MAQVIKQNKLLYYAKSALLKIPPKAGYQSEIKRLRTKLTAEQLQDAEKRISYYNKLDGKAAAGAARNKVKNLKSPKTPKAYYFDTYEYARFFEEDKPLNYVFGDVTEIPDQPSIVKSRPVAENNENSVLLNLDKARHFIWIENDIAFSEKKDILIGRGAVYQQHRHRFYEKYFGNPLCDLGQVNKNGGNEAWIKPKISLEEHLKYKFILSLEGNDVATNLKWIMSSNSIAVMPKPKFETWFMEGQLVGGKHYIEISEDYDDLEEKLDFYVKNPEISLEIVRNANEWCAQFFDKNIEDYCSLRVLEKYFGL